MMGRRKIGKGKERRKKARRERGKKGGKEK